MTLRGESLKIVWQCLYLLSNLIIWPMERVLLGFWQGLRKKKKFFLQLHSEICEYLGNWATCSAAFSETPGASCKCIFIWVVYRYWFSHCARLWVEKHLILKEVKSPVFIFSFNLIRVARPNQNKPNWCVYTVLALWGLGSWSHFRERFFESA